jgi:hypothetical protein
MTTLHGLDMGLCSQTKLSNTKTTSFLGWRSGVRYLPHQDDIALVEYCCKPEPHAPYPELPVKMSSKLYNLHV